MRVEQLILECDVVRDSQEVATRYAVCKLEELLVASYQVLCD